MSVRHCFEDGAVVPQLENTEKFAAIAELIRRAAVFRAIGDLSAFEKAVIEREKSQSTGFGHGIAVPHGRIDGIGRVVIAFGISRKGIAYGAPDGEPVRLLFVIASPPHMSMDYLQALSALVRILRDDRLREKLLASGDPEEARTTIRDAFVGCLARHACGTIA